VLNDITFETMTAPDPSELLGFYQRQRHQTTHEAEKLKRMIDNTFCFVTARRNGEMVGMARGVTDGLIGWLAECKLDPAYQGPACVTRTDGRIEHDTYGIATEMARRVIEALRAFGVERIGAIAHGTEVDFCEDMGFRKMRGAVALELPADVSVKVPQPAIAGQTAG
jgi:hypothetical protein